MIDADAEADARSVERTLAGHRDEFELLVTRYARRVHDLARRMLRDAHEAEDVSQQAFLNAYRALPRFDPRRPFRHWLLRITSNLCRNRLAERRRRPMALGLGGDDRDDDVRVAEPAGREGQASDAASDPSDPHRVRHAIESLPEIYRLTAVLRYVHGLSIDEIAHVTDDPEPTVKTHLHRARAALAALLSDPAPGETRPTSTGTED